MPRQFFSALITTPCQVWRRWNYPLPYYSFLAADTVLYTVTLTSNLVTLTLNFDLEHLQCIACDVMKLCTKFERNRSVRGGVTAIQYIWHNDLEHVLRIAPSSGIIFTKFDLRQLIRAWIMAFFRCWYVMSRCDLDLWPFDLESLWDIKR